MIGSVSHVYGSTSYECWKIPFTFWLKRNETLCLEINKKLFYQKFNYFSLWWSSSWEVSIEALSLLTAIISLCAKQNPTANHLNLKKLLCADSRTQQRLIFLFRMIRLLLCWFLILDCRSNDCDLSGAWFRTSGISDFLLLFLFNPPYLKRWRMVHLTTVLSAWKP